MRRRLKMCGIAILSVLILNSCGKKDKKSSNEKVPTIKDQTLQGNINGESWEFKSGYASLKDGRYMIYLLRQESTSPCTKFFLGQTPRDSKVLLHADQNGLAFKLGDMEAEDESQYGRTVTMVYYDGNKPVNVIANRGRVEISEVTDTEMKGRIVAYFDDKNQINGNFSIPLCSDLNTSNNDTGAGEVTEGKVTELSTFDGISIATLKEIVGLYQEEDSGQYYVVVPSDHKGNEADFNYKMFKFNPSKNQFVGATDAWLDWEPAKKAFTQPFEHGTWVKKENTSEEMEEKSLASLNAARDVAHMAAELSELLMDQAVKVDVSFVNGYEMDGDASRLPILRDRLKDWMADIAQLRKTLKDNALTSVTIISPSDEQSNYVGTSSLYITDGDLDPLEYGEQPE